MKEIVVRAVDCHVFRMVENIPIYLLLKRSRNQVYPNIWQCVTGKIEQGEKALDAALRELKEETELLPVNMWTVDQVNHFFEAEQNRMNLIPVFAVEVATEFVTLSAEHTEYRWCSIEEGINLLLWNQQKQGLQTLHQMIMEKSEKLELSKVSI